MDYIELERAAYLAGNTELANAYVKIDALESEVEELEEKIGDIKTLADWEEKHGIARHYYDFFHACFARLTDHYPCPEISLDHDCSLIFEAIERGEAARVEQENAE